VHLLKTVIDMMPSDTHTIFIHQPKRPLGEHAPTIDEVTIVIV